MIEKDLASKAKKPKIFVLKFQDKRVGYRENNADALKSKGLFENLDLNDDLKNPYFIWKPRVPEEFRFETKTLCDYLYESLIFDLSRLGFNIVSDNKSGLSFKDIINNSEMIPANTSYIIGIDVLMCEPGTHSNMWDVDIFYHYYYHLRIYDISKSKVLYDGELNRTIQRASESQQVTGAFMVETLLHDYLPEINHDIAEILVKYK
ncbi:MAG: hypothetical protein WCO53_09055 [Deltaproteobacteria bacterium]